MDQTGDIFVATNVSGISRSTDGGASWQFVNNGLGLEYESVLLADSLNNIYTGSLFSGLYNSTDKGASWSKTNLSGDVQSAAIISGNRICVGGQQTVSISSDHGKSWSASQVTTDSRVEVLSIAEDFSGNIYAGLEAYLPTHPPAPPFGGGVSISSDSGRTWEFYGMSLTSISSIVASKAGKVFIL
ncbi:MAG: sialidase family protein, partial [Bacteroidota bacterium]